MAHCRRAYTLVELLVVLTLVLILTTVAIALIPRAIEHTNASRGAEQLQGWLLIAKQRAKSDGTPCGLRMVPDANGLVYNLQYVQQVNDFQVVYSPTPTAPTQIRRISASGTTATLEPLPVPPLAPYPDFSFRQAAPPYTPSPANLWPVQIGDHIEFNGGGFVTRIADVPDPLTLTLEHAPPWPLSLVTTYRIIRQARPMQGEPELQLPKDVAIDLATNATYGGNLPPLVSGLVDLIFYPSGQMPFAGSGIFLWVKDYTRDPNDPLQSLICIMPSGFIAAHPVDVTPSASGTPPYANPYSFALDGRSSGL